MLDIFNRYGIEINNRGFVKCPFHAEKTPSLKIYKNNTKYHCFGCGFNGGVIDFVMKYFNITFKQAINKLNYDFSLALPSGDKLGVRDRRKYKMIEEERRKKAEIKAFIKNHYEDMYWEYFDEWKRLDDNKWRYAPKDINEKWHPLFVEALDNLVYIEHILDMYDTERRALKDVRSN